MTDTPELQDDKDTALDIEGGRRLFARPCTFVISAVGSDQVPPTSQPEVAFVGRSNVGKSSLVNVLTGQNTLARTSNTPGRTQQLNFFDLNGQLMLVDLPGYGFAKAPKPDVEKWTRLTKAYLKGRPQLSRVFILIDSRHGLKPVDEGIMSELDQAAVSYQVILTKTDKIKPGQVARVKVETSEALLTHVAAHPEVLTTSSVKAQGIAELRATLLALILQAGGEGVR